MYTQLNETVWMNDVQRYLNCGRSEQTPGKELQEDDNGGMNYARSSITLGNMTPSVHDLYLNDKVLYLYNVAAGFHGRTRPSGDASGPSKQSL